MTREHDNIFLTIALVCLIAVMEVGRIPEDLSQKIPRRSTGIVGLNLLLEGGFPEGSLIMVHGTAVAGVDLAARQFCDGHPGEAGTYVSPEELLDEDGVEEKMNPAVFIDRMNGSRIVVDSLSSLIEKYGIEETLLLLTLAREHIRRKNANLMFIVYSDVHSPMDMTRIMRLSDVVIEFRNEVQQAEIQRTLTVQKIRGGAVPRRMLPFIITENGIEASTTSRVV